MRANWFAGAFAAAVLTADVFGLQADEPSNAGERRFPDTALFLRARTPRTVVVAGPEWLASHRLLLRSLAATGHEILEEPLTAETAERLVNLIDVRDGSPLADLVVLGPGNADKVATGPPLSSKAQGKFLAQVDEFLAQGRGLALMGFGPETSPTARTLEAVQLRVAEMFQISVNQQPTVACNSGWDEALRRSALGGENAKGCRLAFSIKDYHLPTGIFSDALCEGADRVPFVFEGRGLRVAASNLLTLVAVAPPAGAHPTVPLAVESEHALIAVAQSRHNGRVAVGDLTFACADENVATSGTANLALCVELLQWAAQQRGAVEFRSFRHWSTTMGVPKDMYINRERIGAAIDVVAVAPPRYIGSIAQLEDAEEEMNSEGLVAATFGPMYFPYTLQLEYTMMRPYWRRLMRPANGLEIETDVPSYFDRTGNVHEVRSQDIIEDPGGSDVIAFAGNEMPATILTTTLVAPEVHGIFKFVVRGASPFASFIHAEFLAPVRTVPTYAVHRLFVQAAPHYVAFFTASFSAPLFLFALLRAKRETKHKQL